MKNEQAEINYISASEQNQFNSESQQPKIQQKRCLLIEWLPDMKRILKTFNQEEVQELFQQGIRQNNQIIQQQITSGNELPTFTQDELMNLDDLQFKDEELPNLNDQIDYMSAPTKKSPVKRKKNSKSKKHTSHYSIQEQKSIFNMKELPQKVNCPNDDTNPKVKCWSHSHSKNNKVQSRTYMMMLTEQYLPGQPGATNQVPCNCSACILANQFKQIVIRLEQK